MDLNFIPNDEIVMLDESFNDRKLLWSNALKFQKKLKEWMYLPF